MAEKRNFSAKAVAQELKIPKRTRISSNQGLTCGRQGNGSPQSSRAQTSAGASRAPRRPNADTARRGGHPSPARQNRGPRSETASEGRAGWRPERGVPQFGLAGSLPFPSRR